MSEVELKRRVNDRKFGIRNDMGRLRTFLITPRMNKIYFFLSIKEKNAASVNKR